MYNFSFTPSINYSVHGSGVRTPWMDSWFKNGGLPWTDLVLCGGTASVNGLQHFQWCWIECWLSPESPHLTLAWLLALFICMLQMYHRFPSLKSQSSAALPINELLDQSSSLIANWTSLAMYAGSAAHYLHIISSQMWALDLMLHMQPSIGIRSGDRICVWDNC